MAGGLPIPKLGSNTAGSCTRKAVGLIGIPGPTSVIHAAVLVGMLIWQPLVFLWTWVLEPPWSDELRGEEV